MAFAVIFLAILLGAILAGVLPAMVFAAYLGASIVTFCMYALDKAAAQKKQSRIRERTLHLCALACGWPGALLAQQMLRHKSKKQTFRAMFWASVVLNCGVLLACVLVPASDAMLALLRLSH
jgi:uncharacterized membrane protein YsdA (DUF1294 family)